MKLKKIEYVDTDVTGFIESWNKKYWDPLEHYYNDHIKKPPSEIRVWALFKWKNGTENISKKKMDSIRKNYIPILNQEPPKSLDEGKAFLNSLKGGPIWNIFWLHCCNPDLFPIFDQHTYRAMARITGLVCLEMPVDATKIYEVYLEQYVDFTKQFVNANPRTLDQALFAYGRFLKSSFYNGFEVIG